MWFPWFRRASVARAGTPVPAVRLFADRASLDLRSAPLDRESDDQATSKEGSGKRFVHGDFELKTRVVALALLVAVPAGCGNDLAPLEVVPNVDLARYVGTWYEIASYPAPFQEGCTATTAEYTLRDDGTVRVINRCRDGSVDGPERIAEGSARVVDGDTNAKLKVSFFWPFEGDYWIIDLDENYEWAVIGEPRRRFLWILSRTPAMDAAVFDEILSRLPELGYDPARLEMTAQPPG
jgi:apolipoprotein D and lipocalin family protein